jgi:ABC-2 type transport system ATP-binding protein
LGNPIIQLDGLSKSYGPVRALDGISFDLREGPAGLLGPNGAGKTTLLKLLLGLLKADGGSARVAGFDPTRKEQRLELRRSLGYMPEGDCLIPGMNAVELVATLGRITGMSLTDAMKRAHEVLDYVGIEEQRYRPLNEYSTGMKQRLKLAQALVHDPALLLLDEPTNGLDPRGRRDMLELVHDLGHKQGKSILLCSHLLQDVERTCRDVVVIHRGRLIGAGAIADMTRGNHSRVRLRVAGNPAALEAALRAEGYTCEAADSGDIEVHINDSWSDGDELFACAARSGCVVLAMDRVRSSLEQAFMQALER